MQLEFRQANAEDAHDICVLVNSAYRGDYSRQGWTTEADLLQGERDFSDSLSFSKWGIPDHMLFNEFWKIIDTLPRPFHTTLLTLSNHEPYDLPDSTIIAVIDDSYTAKQ